MAHSEKTESNLAKRLRDSFNDRGLIMNSPAAEIDVSDAHQTLLLEFDDDNRHIITIKSYKPETARQQLCALFAKEVATVEFSDYTAKIFYNWKDVSDDKIQEMTDHILNKLEHS